MHPATMRSNLSLVFAAMACCLVGAGAAAAAEAAPDTRNGRYALQPSGDGMVRLDTHTGEVSTCSNSAAGWACYAVPDERKAMDTEIGRLQAENERLKAQLAARDMGKGDLGKGDLGKGEALPKTADSDRKLTIPLPSDQDIDRAMALIEQTWRRLVEMASRVQKDVAGKI